MIASFWSLVWCTCAFASLTAASMNEDRSSSSSSSTVSMLASLFRFHTLPRSLALATCFVSYLLSDFFNFLGGLFVSWRCARYSLGFSNFCSLPRCLLLPQFLHPSSRSAWLGETPWRVPGTRALMTELCCFAAVGYLARPLGSNLVLLPFDWLEPWRSWIILFAHYLHTNFFVQVPLPILFSSSCSLLSCPVSFSAFLSFLGCLFTSFLWPYYSISFSNFCSLPCLFTSFVRPRYSVSFSNFCSLLRCLLLPQLLLPPNRSLCNFLLPSVMQT